MRDKYLLTILVLVVAVIIIVIVTSFSANNNGVTILLQKPDYTIAQTKNTITVEVNKYDANTKTNAEADLKTLGIDSSSTLVIYDIPSAAQGNSQENIDESDAFYKEVDIQKLNDDYQKKAAEPYIHKD